MVGLKWGLASASEEYRFRFSHDKHFRAVTFGQFESTAESLDGIVRRNREGAESKIITCEDRNTYNYSTVTFDSEEIETALKNRKEYGLDNLALDVWERSYNVGINITVPNSNEPFMVCASIDKTADSNRLKFHGQWLDKQTYSEIMQRFHYGNLFHKLGDGMGKISDFNMAMGHRLTGINILS